MRSGSKCKLLSIALPAKVFGPGNTAYKASIASYWAQQGIKSQPRCVVSALKVSDISTIHRVISSRKAGNDFPCKLAIRSVGHGVYGSSNEGDGITVDISAMNSISVNDARNLTSIGPGAKCEDVYLKLDTIGLGVLASVEQHSDLFVALRGGSNNCGVITRVDIRTFEQGEIWAKQHLNVFYNFIANPKYDPYAFVIQSFGVNNDLEAAVRNSYAYTKPETSPSVIQELSDIDSLFDTTRTLNLANFTIEMASSSPPGLRQIIATTAYIANLDMLEASYEIFDASVAYLSHMPGLQYSWSNQGIPPSITSKTRVLGGNVLNLDPVDGTLILCLITATWNTTADDDTVTKVIQDVIRTVDATSKAKGVFHSFMYLNHVAEWRLDMLIAMSREYDLHGTLQKVVPGGFKLP
ncbi:hypothetical protein K469DRAFT_803085 [Zopfia rhizophila CBS 207.26]|uniref:FAD linked oxidase N-terminal domain-containing protein n=1 Tax=Zopfia rhizophila CBS 207.26 TaxID=1314779 RepID=A0A6A6DGR7_9PEZI|nr:hypothetical protein K469DRAFT_803085 [Zopfia rhizophila CBS 207.26]